MSIAAQKCNGSGSKTASCRLADFPSQKPAAACGYSSSVLAVIRRHWGPLSFSALTLAFLAGRLLALGDFNWTHDEGAYISAGWMVSKGYHLYEETMCSSPPLLIHLLAFFLSVFGRSISVARAAIVVYCVIGFICVGLIAKEMDGWPAAILASAILFIPSEIFSYSLRAFSTVPAMCLVAGAILAEIRYFRTGSRAWLVLAGVMTAGGLLTKLLVMFAIPMPIMAVLLRHFWRGHRRSDLGETLWLREIAIDSLVALLSIFLPIAVYLLAMNPQAAIENTIQFQLEGRTQHGLWIIDNLWEMLKIMRDQLPLVILAAIGAGRLYRIRPLRSTLLIGGSLALVAFLLNHSPLYDHHVTAVFFPLAILAAVEISAIARHLLGIRVPGIQQLTRTQIVEIAILPIFALSLVVSLNSNRLEWMKFHTPDESELSAIQFLQRTTQPGDLVVSDEPLLPLLAERKIVPMLTEVSWKRLRVGDLSPEEMIELTERRHPAAVVIWKERFENTVYDHWVRRHYSLAHLDSSSHRVYLESTADIPDDYHFTEELILLGYNYEVGDAVANIHRLEFTVFWRPLTPSGMAQLRFELIDSSNHVVGTCSGAFQWDDETKNDEFDFVPDHRVLDMVPGTPPGQYHICVTHLAENGQVGDRVLIGPIELPSNAGWIEFVWRFWG